MRGFLLDTCVVSEFSKPAPNLGVVEWLSRVDGSVLYLSAITIGELRYGIARQPGKRRDALEEWLHSRVLTHFGDRILSFSSAVADFWGTLRARARANGTTAPVIDGMIAATALHHHLRVVTRNEPDFARMGLDVLNPWRLEA